jgi:hypothetical protein
MFGAGNSAAALAPSGCATLQPADGIAIANISNAK